jgi:phospholipid/cholesterol/gamma-HCH transport system ATP-binding protein
MGDSTIIDVQDLTMAYGERVVMKDLSFQVRKGEIFVIMGGAAAGRARC